MDKDLDREGLIQIDKIVTVRGSDLYLYSTRKVAKYLGKSEGGMRNLITKGIVPKPLLVTGAQHRWLAAEAAIFEEAYARYDVRRGVRSLTDEFSAYIHGEFSALKATLDSCFSRGVSPYEDAGLPKVLYMRLYTDRSRWSDARRKKAESTLKEERELLNEINFRG